MLGRHEGRATPFTTDRQPLHQPQKHKQHRCQDTNLIIGRQQADESAGNAHQQHGGHQPGLAPVLVTDIAK
ncbi:hypothetical protein D3C71_1646110 [compost metagenome]